MPHSFLKSPKLQLAKYIAISLAYAEGMARRWAEQEIAKIIDKLRNKCPSLPVLKSLQATVDRIKSLKFAISVVKFLMQINVIVIISGNHATKEQRKLARQKIKKKYSEIWISSPLSVCKKRDVKNLFKNAKQNNINNLVGHDIKFDKPKNYDLKLDTTKRKVDCVNKLFTFLKNKKILIKK